MKINEGDIFRVPLPNDISGFGRVLVNTWGFFDFFQPVTESVDIEKLMNADYAFKIWVTEFPIKKKIWPVIGNQPLTSDEKEKIFFYKQDPINNELWKTLTGMEEIPVSVDECKFLDVAAVYDPEHVVRRLNNFFLKNEDPFSALELKRLLTKGVSTSNAQASGCN